MKTQDKAQQDKIRGTLGGHAGGHAQNPDSIEFWKNRIKIRKGGSGKTVPGYQVRFRQSGKESWFNLHTANAATAAQKARDIHRVVAASGLAEAISQFKRKDPISDRFPTIGEWLASVKKSYDRGDLRESTLQDYFRKTRTLFAGTLDISADGSKHDYVNGGHWAWMDKLERQSMEKITPERIKRYLNLQVDAANKSGPLAGRTKMRTLNSLIRSAKALFAAKHNEGNPLAKIVGNPLRETGLFKAKVPKFKPSQVIDEPESKTIGWFLLEARRDLMQSGNDLESVSRRECLKEFLLAIMAGLRRSEIDRLLWNQIRIENGVPSVVVETTEHGEAKSNEEQSFVAIDDELFRLLQNLRSESNGIFVLQGPQKVNHKRTDSHRYRAEATHSALIKWLRSKGVTARCPIHAMRKLIGSHINAHHGNDRAATFLRHADSRITAAIYAEPVRVAAGIGHFLSDSDE